MKKLKPGIAGITALLLLVFNACEKVLEIDIPFKERKLVINSILNPDSIVSVHVSKSMHILDKKNMAAIDDAGVKLYEDGVFVNIIPPKFNGFYELDDFKPSPGKTYRIEVSAGAHDPVKAEDVIPWSVDIKSIDTNRVKGEYNQGYLRCFMKFNDPAGVSNYYMVRGRALMHFQDWDPQTDSIIQNYYMDDLWISSQDPVIEEEGGLAFAGLIFSDNYFEGKTYNFSFSFPVYHLYGAKPDDNFEVYLYLYSLSADYYRYLKSYELQAYAREDPFAEPVTVYNNIENGFGIFAGFSVSSDTINIPYKSTDNHPIW